MGHCTSCLFGSSREEPPDYETRRRQQAEAAEKRQKANESRGIKDPEALKRKQHKQQEMEKRAEQSESQQGGGLKWTVG